MGRAADLSFEGKWSITDRFHDQASEEPSDEKKKEWKPFFFFFFFFFLFIKRQEAGSTLHLFQLWWTQRATKTSSAQSSFLFFSHKKLHTNEKQKKNRTSQCAKPRNEDRRCSVNSESLADPSEYVAPLSLYFTASFLNSKIKLTLLAPRAPRDQQMANKLVLCNH